MNLKQCIWSAAVLAAFFPLSVGQSAAFWNPFKAQPPEVSASYDTSACTGVGKILVAIRNPTSEPLSTYRFNIKIYKPQRSSVVAEIGHRSDYVVQPNSTNTVCFDIAPNDVVSFLGFTDPNASYWDLTMKYGDPSNYAGREFLNDAIFRVEVTDFTYGLPY